MSLKQVITTNLHNFFEKRRANGDSRPCGSQNMAPIYLSNVDIDKEELEDDKFVGRVRRSGLGSA